MSALYRIVQADTLEAIELGDRFAYSIEAVEAEIRAHPERFVVKDPESYASPTGWVVKRVVYDAAGDEPVILLGVSPDVDALLKLRITQELARRVIEIWREGQSMHDVEELEDAVATLADVLPPKTYPPITYRPGDPF